MLLEATLAFLHRIQLQPSPPNGHLAPADAYRAACSELSIRPSRRLLRHFEEQVDCYASASGVCLNPKHCAGDKETGRAAAGVVVEVDLSNDFLGPVGCTALLAVLPHLPHLCILKLDANGLTSEFAVTLCCLLRQHPSIMAVSLANNRLITLPASRAMLSLLDSNRRIGQFRLQGTQVPASIIQLIDSLTCRNFLSSAQNLQRYFAADSEEACQRPRPFSLVGPTAPYPTVERRPPFDAETNIFVAPALTLLSSTNSTHEVHGNALAHPVSSIHGATSSSSSNATTADDSGHGSIPEPCQRRSLTSLPYLDLLCSAAANEHRQCTPPSEGMSPDPPARWIRWHHHCALWAPDTTLVPPTDPSDPFTSMVMSSRHHHPLLKPDTPEVLQGGPQRCAFCQWRSYHIFMCLRCDVAICITCFTPFHYCAPAPGQRRVSPRDCPDMQEFYTHVRRGDRQRVADILDASPDPTLVADGLIAGVCHNYPSPLVCAAYCGQTGVAEELLRHGADPMCQWLGLSAERWAINMGHRQTAMELRRCRLVAQAARWPSSGPTADDGPCETPRLRGLLRRLGEDALVHVFQYLPPFTLLRTCATCSAWRTIIDASCLMLFSLPIHNQPVDEVFAFSPSGLLVQVDWFGKELPPAYQVSIPTTEDE